MADPMTPERPRCGALCLKHAHTCDRSLRHTGFHRDVQQKGDHTCEWDTPGPKDFGAVMTALRSARAELATFVSPGHLAPGETPALCGTCEELLCVPGLSGCARCVKAEVERLRLRLISAEQERDAARGVAQSRADLADQMSDERDALEAERNRLRDDWRTEYERLSRQLLRRHHAWQSAKRGRKQARAELATRTDERDEARRAWMKEYILRDKAEDERDRLAQQAERVRARHTGVCSGACGLDDACECEDRDLICAEDNDRWPCPTRRDLDGTEAGS